MTTNSGNCEHAARVIEAVLVMVDWCDDDSARLIAEYALMWRRLGGR